MSVNDTRDAVDNRLGVATQQEGWARSLRRVDDRAFESPPLGADVSRVFGGRIVAEAFLAAGATAVDGHLPHSLHLQFLRAGRAAEPVVYHVNVLRDGRRFSSREVRVMQGERLISTALVSLTGIGQGIADRHDAAPDVPRPDDLADQSKAYAEVRAMNAPAAGMIWRREHPMEIRPVGLVEARAGEDAGQVLERADSLLRLAKAAGRDRLAVEGQPL